MPNTGNESSRQSWPTANQNHYLNVSTRNESTVGAESFLQQSASGGGNSGELYGMSTAAAASTAAVGGVTPSAPGRYPNRTTLSENYTVLPVGHGNFLKVYHSNENESPAAFNSYELFSSNSIISSDNVLPHQNLGAPSAATTTASFENRSPSQFQNNDTTTMIINQLVTNWSPNLTGTYSPFGEHGNATTNFPLNVENTNKSNMIPQQQQQQQPQSPLNKTVGVNNLRTAVKTNGSFENNPSSNMPEVKKRIIAEVKPMRMSYSDVLSKNVAFNSHSASNQNNQNLNFASVESGNQSRNQKIPSEKIGAVRANPQIISDRKSNDDKEKIEFKPRKDAPVLSKVGEIPSTNSATGAQKEKKRFNIEEKELLTTSQNNKQAKKTQESIKNKNKNSQASAAINTKKKSHKQGDSEGGDIKSNNSKAVDKEFFYNVAKNETVGERYQKNVQHGSSKKRQTNGTQRNNSRTEKVIYSKRSQKQQKDMKYEMIVRFLEKWYEYTLKILIWLFYLIYDVIVLGFSMVIDWLQNVYGGMCVSCTNFRKDFKNNSGKPNAWLKNIFKKLDSKFKKNSNFAFWRSFYKKRQQEPVTDFYKNGRLPQTGEEAMYSLLNCKGKDAYSILGVSSDSSQEQIRKHYKKIAVLVHPDKNKQPGAEEAFKVLQRAFELIGEPENRKSYDQSLAEALNAEKAWTELHDLLSQLQSKIAEAANTIRCSSCGLRHPRKLTERPHYAARECSSCKISHSAREGDIWAETSLFGLRWKYYALMEGKVYDITEWANCQKGALSHLQPNSHIVQYRIVRGGQQNQQNLQQEKERSSNRETPSEPSLDDFLDNLYSGQNPQNQQQNSSRRRSRRN